MYYVLVAKLRLAMHLLPKLCFSSGVKSTVPDHSPRSRTARSLCGGRTFVLPHLLLRQDFRPAVFTARCQTLFGNAHAPEPLLQYNKIADLRNANCNRRQTNLHLNSDARLQSYLQTKAVRTGCTLSIKILLCLPQIVGAEAAESSQCHATKCNVFSIQSQPQRTLRNVLT